MIVPPNIVCPTPFSVGIKTIVGVVPSTSSASKLNENPSVTSSNVVSMTTGGSFTAFTVIETVAVSETSSVPSLAVYVKESKPLKLSDGSYVTVLPTGNVSEPFSTSSSIVKVNSCPSAS